MRVLTFSTVFPSFHPRKGEQTYFMREIQLSIYPKESLPNYVTRNPKLLPKHHTIREGKRWKVGDWFSARLWEGKPYRSKQTEFAQIQVKKVWDFVIDRDGTMWVDKYLWQQPYDEIASNDGLSNQDFIDWLIKPAIKRNKEWRGQIICWSDKVEYSREKIFS